MVKNNLAIFRNSFGKDLISSRLSRKVLLPYSVTNSSFSALLLLTCEPSEWNSDTRTFAKVPKPDVLMNMGDRGRMEFVGSTARQIWLPVNVRGRMSETAIFLFGINCSRHSAVPCMSRASSGTKDSPAIKKLSLQQIFHPNELFC